MISKKNIIMLSILIISLPIIIYLARQTQIFKPKAVGENSSLDFISGSGGQAITQTNNQNVWLKLTWGSFGTTPPILIMFILLKMMVLQIL